MKIKSSSFLMSNTKVEALPSAHLPEYAFIGRSNVGKSSLINSILGKKAIAKVSSTPGKTKLINHFLINENWYLVDLPGYGYAKVSKKDRAEFNKINMNYFSNRENLQCCFTLVDSRVEPQKIDIEFINWIAERGIPQIILFTKADKLKLNELNNNVQHFQKKLLEYWEELPPMLVTSSVDGRGKEQLFDIINDTNNHFFKKKM